MKENFKNNNSSQVIVQYGLDSFEKIKSRSDAFDFIEKQLSTLLSLMPHLKTLDENLNGRGDKLKDELLTVEEACEIVKLSRPTIYDMIKAGELPCFEIGRRKQKRIKRGDLEKIGVRKE